jgi:hypothetical protein
MVMPLYGNSIPSYTWATKPAASSFSGQALFSDIGVNGSVWYSNGSKWVHESPIIMAQSGILMMIPSSGSIGNNGALTLTTALPVIYSEGVYMYFPANAISAGSAAGLYYVVMSSTTAGTIYNNTYVGGQPSIPTGLVAFATTGPGAYTQSTGLEVTLVSFIVQGGVLGVNGKLDFESIVENNNSGGSKSYKVKFDSVDLVAQSTTTSLGGRYMSTISNAGIENKQRTMSSSTSASIVGTVSVGAAFQNTTVDTSQNVTASITGSLAVATDYCMVRAFSAEVLPT